MVTKNHQVSESENNWGALFVTTYAAQDPRRQGSYPRSTAWPHDREKEIAMWLTHGGLKFPIRGDACHGAPLMWGAHVAGPPLPRMGGECSETTWRPTDIGEKQWLSLSVLPDWAFMSCFPSSVSQTSEVSLPFGFLKCEAKALGFDDV